MMRETYDVRNCQSLFGYAQEVHDRSRGVCQLCGAGAGSSVSFDFWRQLTVEHLIGRSQGGHYAQIMIALKKKWPAMAKANVEELAWKIELENMVTACSFCNAMTSREQHDVAMLKVIAAASDSEAALMKAVQREAGRALTRKKSVVRRKLSAVRDAFEAKVLPKIRRAHTAV